jgi:hypothetical protein
MSFIAYAFAAFIAGQVAESAAAGQPPAATATDPTLEQMRAATERFRDVKVALAEGYVRDPMDHCVVAQDIGRPAQEGAMGIHYIRMDLLGINGPPNPRVDGTSTHTDFTKPAILLYEPKADGSLELVGVENLVFKKAWAAAGHESPPTFHGVVWDSMEDDPATPADEAHMFTPHFDRHVWLYRENPKGLFTEFNPNVSCAAHKPVASEHSADTHKAAADVEEPKH